MAAKAKKQETVKAFAFPTYESVKAAKKQKTERPQKKKYDVFMVIIGNKLYSFSTVRADGTGMQGHDSFLNSIVLSN